MSYYQQEEGRWKLDSVVLKGERRQNWLSTFVNKFGVIAFGTTLKECEHELRSTLEDWLLAGLKLGRVRCFSNEVKM